MTPPIEDHALLGDLETAALVGRDGCVDWLCLPRFDSPACLAALLGTPDNGFWRLAPVEARDTGGRRCAGRSYRPGTLVLDTLWHTATGTARVTDFMPPLSRLPCLVRLVEGLTGGVRMRSELRLRFQHGKVVPWIRAVDHCTVAVAGPDAVWLAADGPLGEPYPRAATGAHGVADVTGGPDLPQSTVLDFTVPAGRRLALMLAWAPSHLPERPLPLWLPAETMLKETCGFWRRWVAGCRYDGPWAGAVERSLITLKALTSVSTGGIVAAPTASLPGCVGGVRNWDQRHCWLRDSARTVRCLLRAGHREEAAAWLDWLVRAVAGDPAELQAVYGVEGRRLLPETEAPWLSGHRGSRPVRFGSLAAGPPPPDVYGEVMAAAHEALRAGIPLPEHAWRLVESLMAHLARHWREPDRGPWQVRGPDRRFTHSGVMTWAAADRALAMARLLAADAPVGAWERLRARAHREVCQRGWDPDQRSFVQSSGCRGLDATALLMPRLGFLPARDPRVRGTVLAVGRELEHGGLLHRYAPARHGTGTHPVDGLPGPEGVHPACTLWYADALAATGSAAEAREAFERVLAVRNDVGLLAEQWDPGTGRQLGNIPHAVSHAALADTAFTLSRAPSPGRESRHGPAA
ncbi:glycoside hydrolase family 15 protein [Streptomyces sp. NPDC047000]|uniref:glycoside hydrolase family 15 protein n=1 Tax=Streptomyces sp. NPDC047000 TaxID=3155474 RepID=UPI0033ED97B3